MIPEIEHIYLLKKIGFISGVGVLGETSGNVGNGSLCSLLS